MSSKATKFESLLEAVPDALVGMDPSGVIQFVNHQTELLFGHERGDLVGQHVETLVPQTLWQVYSAHRDEYFADRRTRGMALDLELSARHRDGSEFPVIVSLSGIDTGDVLLEFVPVSDLTRKSQAFDKDQRMTAIVENCDDAIIGKTLRGTITTWNPGAQRMYGFSSKEIIGRSIDLLTPADRAGEVTAILTRLKSGQSVEHFETVRVRKDGSAIRVSISESPIRDQYGVVVGASTIARDMTEARRAFESARSMIESSLDSLVAISPEGMITDVNEATVKATGVPRDELIGTAFSDYFTDPERANRIYQLVVAEGAAVDYPLSLRHRDGSLTEVLYNASVFRDADGNVLGAFAAARDVTKQMRAQRENAEQQAREREQLVELQQFQFLTVGRELQMTEMKKENERLRGLLPGRGAERSDQR